MAKYLPLPDGNSLKVPDEMGYSEAMALAQQRFPDLFGEVTAKEPGFMDRMGRGLESLISTQRTALGSLYDKDYAKKGIERQKEISKKYGETDDWEAVKKKYEESGLLSAAGEYLSRVPGALAEQVPQMAESAAAARLGALGGPAGAAAGFIAPSYTQAYGTLLERQAEEQAKQGQPVDPNKLQAGLLAVPYSAIDVAARYIPMGKGIVKSVFGDDVAKLLFRGATKEAEELAAKKLTSESFLKTLGAGTAKGAAFEIPGEVSQQFIERFQAGLPLLNDDALSEYGRTAFSTSMLAPLGGVGRFSEKSGARQLLAKRKQEENAAAAAEKQRLADIEAAKLEEYQKTPEYLTDVQARYDAVVTRLNELKAATKIKPEGDDPASQQIAAAQKEQANKELKDYRASEEFRTTVAEYVKAKPRIKEVETQRKATEAVFGQQDLYAPEDTSPAGQAARLQAQIADLQKQQAKKGLTLAEQQPLQNRINALESSLQELVPSMGEYSEAKRQLDAMIKRAGESLSTATTTADLQRSTDNLQRLEAAKAELEKLRPMIKAPAVQPSVSQLRDQVDAAQAAGDTAALQRLIPMLAEAEKQGQLPFATGYESENQLAAEIAQGREEGTRRNEVVAAETAALFRIGARGGLTEVEKAIRQKRLDEAREIMRLASKPAAERRIIGYAFKVQPGGKLNQSTRASMLVRENEQDWAAFDKEAKENAFNVKDREALQKQLKAKLKDLEAEYNSLSQYGPSQAMAMVNAETAAIESALAQVERKLKLGVEAQRTGQVMYAGQLYKPTYKFGAPYTRKGETKPKGELADVESEAVQASDERVADLIDRLLPFATGEKPRTPEEAQALEDLQTRLDLGQTALFDVEAQKQLAGNLPAPEGGVRRVQFDEEGNRVIDETTVAPTPPGVKKVDVAPIEQVANLIERSQELEARLAEYNEKIKAEGQMPDIEKLQEKLAAATTDAAKTRIENAISVGLTKIARVNDLKDLRNGTLDELVAVRNQYARLYDIQTPAYAAKEVAPSTSDLFGGLEEARAEQNKIQKNLDQLYKERDTLRADLQRRGQVGATPQLQALVEQYSKDTPRLRQVEEEIEKQEAELERVSGKRSERFDAFAQAREAERTAGGPNELARLEEELRGLKSAQPYMEQMGQGEAAAQIAKAITDLEGRIDRIKEGKAPVAPRERTQTLPGFERRAGVRPVDEQQLRDARTDLVSLQNAEEDLRKTLASQDANPTRYLRQLAIDKNEQYEAFLVQSDDPITKTWPAQKLTILKRRYPKTVVPTQRDIEYHDALRKQIKLFENVIRGNSRRSVEQALQDNQAKQDKARERISELESRQRAYEQQEAVRTGAAPGEAEAQRLIEGAGYRTPSGATRKMPKKLASWGITEITKKTAVPVASAKVAMTSNVLRQYQKQTEAAATTGAFTQDTLNNQLRRATANIEKLNAALQQVYPTTVAETTDREITDLLAAGMSPEARANTRDMAQVYANLKNSVAGNTINDVIARLEELKADLLQQARQGGRFTARRGGVELHRNEVEDDIKGIKALHKRTESGTVQERVADLTQTIRHLMMQPKTADPWTASFNALIQETNAKALLASQEANYAGLVVESEKRKLDSFSVDTQERIAKANKMPASAEKTALLDELNSVLEKQLAGLPVEPRAVSDVTALGMEEMQRRYEVGAYNAQLDAYNKAVDENNTYQEQYQKARIEQLSLLKAYGNDLQTNINAEVSKIQTLTPQLEAQAKANAETKAQLDKANQALAKARIAEREAAAKTVPPQTAGMTYTAKEREALQRIRQGLGLPGTRYETDTTSALVTKTKAAIRQTLTLEQAKLDKIQEPIKTAEQRLAQVQTEKADAKRRGDWDEADRQQIRIDSMQEAIAKLQTDNAAKVQEQTLKVQELQQAFESVQQLGERVITPVGEGAAEREVERVETDVIPGTRLPRRRVGPVARVGTQPPGQMLSGTSESREAISKGNRPMQAGTQRLTAADMNQQSASSVSLAVLQQQRDAATGDRKTQLDAAFAAATDGMTAEQIKDKIKEGNDLIKVPGAATVVAAKEKVRAANEALKVAEASRRAATTPAGKEIAQDDVDMAQAELDRAYAKLEAAQNAVAAGVEPNTTPKDAVQKAFDEAAEAELGQKTGKTRATQATEDLYGGDVAMEYTTATRTESNAATQEAIKDGRFMEAVERLAVDSDNPLIRETANDIRRLLLRTKVVIDPELTVNGKPVPAAYDPATNTVKFRSSEITDEDITHEAVHAVTLQVLRTPDDKLTPQQRNAKRELIAIYKKASERGDLKKEYGITDVEEFVSEMQSNVEFRAAVDKQPWYKRFWHALTRLWSNKPIEKISEQSSALIKQLYLPSTNVLAGKQVASIFRGETAPESSIVGREPGKLATLRGNLFGLSGRVQYIDRLAAADEGIVAAEGAGKLSSTEAFNAQYFMRMSDKVTQAAGQFITSGPVEIVSEKVSNGVEYRYQSTTGANLIPVSEGIDRMAKAAGISPAAAEDMLTVLIAGQRADAHANGWERLQAKNPDKARAEYAKHKATLRANPELAAAANDAMTEYKKYNEGLLNFAAQCGYLSKDEVARLNKMPYVPFYRVEEGNVKLFVLGERPITIGNIKDNPDLKQFLGDEQKIQPILTSAVQNTFMLTRAAMHNKATMETSNAMFKAGFVSKMGKGPGLSNTDTVHYKIDGVDHFATIDSDTFGIPAELIVRGMEGIKTTIPDVVKLMGFPADVLRKFITRSPAYVIRQLIREPVNAFILSGVDGVPIVNTLRQLGRMYEGRSPAETDLMRGLVVSSNIYTGGEADMQKFLNDVAAGRSGWDKFLGKLDTMALQADAATRAVIYEDSLKKGFSIAQAQFRAMESQNFGRRGLSPSVQMLNAMIPFFNAQIQGLDVLYRSLRGKMPYSEQLEIQRKIMARGTLLFVGSMAYAAMMQDDEAYKKAKPEERYGNYFMRIPGVKDPLKIPVPFEAGLFFMGLPQALVDIASGNTKASEAFRGLGKLLKNSVPGVIPAGAKPLYEAYLGQTEFGPVESEREKKLLATERFRPGTTEVSKALGSVTGHVGVSPLLLDHLIRGYTGPLGVALLSTLNPVLRSKAEGEAMPQGMAKQPFIGGMFQTSEGRFLIERAYERMDEVVQAQQTYKDMIKRGQLDRAQAFAKENTNLIMGERAAGSFRQQMGKLFADERQIIGDSRLSGPEKERRVQRLKDLENEYARRFYALTERTTHR